MIYIKPCGIFEIGLFYEVFRLKERVQEKCSAPQTPGKYNLYNLILSFYFCPNVFSLIVFSILFRVSNHQIVDTEN